MAVAEGDLFTAEEIYGEQGTIGTVLHRLTVDADGASLRGSFDLGARTFSTARPDGAGHLILNHAYSWSSGALGGCDGGLDCLADRMAVLDLGAGHLELLAELPLDVWTTLIGIEGGRAVYNANGNVLVVNLEDASHPYAQALHRLPYSIAEITVDGDDIFAAGGHYGAFRFALDRVNLDPAASSDGGSLGDFPSP